MVYGYEWTENTIKFIRIFTKRLEYIWKLILDAEKGRFKKKDVEITGSLFEKIKTKFIPHIMCT